MILSFSQRNYAFTCRAHSLKNKLFHQEFLQAHGLLTCGSGGERANNLGALPQGIVSLEAWEEQRDEDPGSVLREKQILQCSDSEASSQGPTPSPAWTCLSVRHLCLLFCSNTHQPGSREIWKSGNVT